MRWVVWPLIGAVLLSACGVVSWRRLSPHGAFARPYANPVFASNGERIYFTAANEGGETIRYSGGPRWGGMMMGSSLTCAACHGTDGRGGLHTMHMEVMDAPDIRFSALSGETEGHGEHGHEDEDEGYTLEDFRQAVVEGRHGDGDDLSRDMPRWQMSDEDLADLLEYLKALQ